MKNPKSLFLTLSILSIFLTMTFVGCKDDDDVPPTQTNEKLTLNFEGTFGGTPLTFNEMKWITAANDTLNFSRISFLMSSFELEKANGERVALPDTNALISLGVNRKVLQFSGTLPEGNFVKLHFKIGLDSAINFGDPSKYNSTHPLNPIVNQMHWNWAGGYIFMVTEGYYTNNGNTAPIFTYHMANMEYAKNISIDLPTAFSIEQNTNLDVEIAMDNYFNTPNQFSIKQKGNSSHSISAEDRVIMDKLHVNLETVFKRK